MNILIVEDDVSIHSLLKELLIRNAYNVVDAYSASEALLLLKDNNFDLIILDLMLPGGSGEDVIRNVKNSKIIVLSAKTSSDDKCNCLMLGANDYITKPFDNNELLARIKVQLRNKENFDGKVLKYKDLELLDDRRTLLIDKHKINLTKTEYAILKQLLLSPKQVIAKNKLLDLISADTEDCDEASLKVHISNIRKKMKNVSNKDYIESVWGIGFKMSE